MASASNYGGLSSTSSQFQFDVDLIDKDEYIPIFPSEFEEIRSKIKIY